jgi:hypothetical protein
MLDSYETDCELKNQEVDKSVLEKSRNIAARLSGKAEPAKTDQTVDDFLHHKFTIPTSKNCHLKLGLFLLSKAAWMKQRKPLM